MLDAAAHLHDVPMISLMGASGMDMYTLPTVIMR